MRIQRLDITGFKSFLERAVFTFDDGVTGVVGPTAAASRTWSTPSAG
jgi:chromosome segregation ATPase